MTSGEGLKVAVLLATYNGSEFVEAQIQSLKHNRARFALHWIDDQSTDQTRAIVRTAAREAEIELVEWHHEQRQGFPGAFFRLLEVVEADVYLFCDQDDIWQPGKIDATVASVAEDLQSPRLCFSDPLIFDGEYVAHQSRFTYALGMRPAQALEGPRGFIFCLALGHTLGFTRALRDIVCTHSHIAREYGGAHDVWMYLIASAIGTVRLLEDVPTTLYRMHRQNTSGDWRGKWERVGLVHLLWRWRAFQRIRRAVAKMAKGFILSASTLPPGPNLQTMLAVAQRLEQLEQTQTLRSVIQMLRLKCFPLRADLSALLAAACLFSDASAAR